jgi:hypothetical protein
LIVAYRNEKEIYPAVCQWLMAFLQKRHKDAEIRVFDSSRKSLARLIQETGLIANLPPEWQSWDIYVDVVGFARTPQTTALAFVECKIVAITLAHLSQLLGYSRVALPHYSIVLSPQGASDALKSLLVTFERKDVLAYQTEKGKLSRSIAVARWDETGSCIDLSSTISGDDNIWR